MNTTHILVLGLVAALPGFGCSGDAGTKTSDGIAWRGSFDEALKDAKASGKPIFADFYGES